MSSQHGWIGWLKQEKIGKRGDNDLTENSGNHTMMVDRVVTQDQNHLYQIKLNQLKSWKCNKSWTILTVNMTM